MSERKYTYNEVLNYRSKLIEKLEEYNGDEYIKLDVPKDFFNRVLFYYRNGCRHFAIPMELARKLDLSDACFDNVNISGYNFKGCYGVKINPQEVAGGVLEHGNVLYNFGKYFVKIGDLYPKKVLDMFLRVYHDLSNCVFDGVEFTGPFDNCLIRFSDFSGSKGAVINPETLNGDMYIVNIGGQTIEKRIKFPIINCNFKDVEFDGKFNDTILYNSSFAGSKGAYIDYSELKKLDIKGNEIIPIYGCNFKDVDIAPIKDEDKGKILIK